MSALQHITAASPNFAKYDAVVVGSGPSGAITARTLAERGLCVLVLEFGSVVSPGSTYFEHQAPYSRGFSPSGSLDANPWTACCVGGGMAFYDAITFRYRDIDLKPSKYLSSDMNMDWPIEVEELDESYRYVESLLRVSGSNGICAFPESPRGGCIFDAMTSLNIHPKRIPLAIDHPEAVNGCLACSPCDERSCPTNARASVRSRRVLDDTDLLGNITTLYGCFVYLVELSSASRGSALECYVPFSAENLRIPFDRLFICTNAVQSAALLLRSQSLKAPNGIGNEADLVGRGLSFKVSGYSVGYSEKWGATPHFSATHKGPHATVYTDDFYETVDSPCGIAGLIYEANYAQASDNQVRLVLHTAAYWLMLTLREAVPTTDHLSNAEFATPRLRLLKLGARVIETVSRIRLAFAAACPEASLFRQIALTSWAHFLFPFGVGGFGYMSQCQFYNEADLNRYLSRVEAGEKPVWKGVVLSQDDLMRRTVMFSLRSSGVVLSRFELEFDVSIEQYFGRELKLLTEAGLVAISNDGVLSLTAACVINAGAVSLLFFSEDVLEQVAYTESRITDKRADLLEKHDYSPAGRYGSSAEMRALFGEVGGALDVH